jgi:hypothetical protein
MRVAVFALLVLTLAACGGSSTQAAGTGISIETTDVESSPMGEGPTCIAHLSAQVDVAYLAEHDVRVKDDAATAAAIKAGVAQVCAEGPPDLTVHGGAHRVVHFVREKFGSG